MEQRTQHPIKQQAQGSGRLMRGSHAPWPSTRASRSPRLLESQTWPRGGTPGFSPPGCHDKTSGLRGFRAPATHPQRDPRCGVRRQVVAVEGRMLRRPGSMPGAAGSRNRPAKRRWVRHGRQVKSRLTPEWRRCEGSVHAPELALGSEEAVGPREILLGPVEGAAGSRRLTAGRRWEWHGRQVRRRCPERATHE